MPFRDLVLMVLICAVWGLSNVISKVVVSDLAVPPLFYAVARAAVIVLVVAPWLLPVPKPAWRTVTVALLMGGGSFALLFIGLQTAAPSSAAIVGQIGVPTVTLLSVFVLGERIRPRRGFGIALTLAGVLIVMWNPAGFSATTGLILVAGSALAGAVGAVIMKQMEGIRPLRFQAWVGFCTVLFCGPLSLAFEENQLARAVAGGWEFLALTLFSALFTSVFAHTCYYGLIQRYEANLVAALTLMAPLFTIAFGVWLTDDPFGIRMALGSALALLGVLIIATGPGVSQARPVLARSAAD
jgi:drug/metabolite transporter (DMT)-like permease